MNLNTKIFFKINSAVGRNWFVDAVGRSGAEWVILVMLSWFSVASFVFFEPNLKHWLVSILFLGVVVLVAWGLNAIIGLVVKMPRPYVVYPQTKTLFSPLPHFPNKTFPSDHTTLAFVIFFVSLFLGLPWSWHLLPLALWVGWGRVYCGVHYPGDVFGGILVSMGIAMFLKLWVVHEFFILLSFI